MTSQLLLAACVCIVAGAIIAACLDALIVVWIARYTNNGRWALVARWLGWYWNAAQWKLANVRFDITVRFNNWKAGF